MAVTRDVSALATASPIIAASCRGDQCQSVDALRGIAMVLMALDHTRGFLSNARFAPVDLVTLCISSLLSLRTDRAGPANFLFTSDGPIAEHPPGMESIWAGYVGWILIVIALYPMCRAFADVKARRRDWWLSYL